MILRQRYSNCIFYVFPVQVLNLVHCWQQLYVKLLCVSRLPLLSRRQAFYLAALKCLTKWPFRSSTFHYWKLNTVQKCDKKGQVDCPSHFPLSSMGIHIHCVRTLYGYTPPDEGCCKTTVANSLLITSLGRCIARCLEYSFDNHSPPQGNQYWVLSPI